MNCRSLCFVLYGATVVVAGVGMFLTWHAVPPRSPGSPVDWTAPRLVAPISPESLAHAAAVVIQNDPFRLDRHPASIPYRFGVDGTPAPPPPPKPPKPSLAVSGIVGGPPWQALLDGIPGRSGSLLVRPGDTLAGLRVRAITPTTVTITGLDTMWTLSLKRVWQ